MGSDLAPVATALPESLIPNFACGKRVLSSDVMTMSRGLLVVPLALAAVALPAAASSAPVSTSFKIVGDEYAFTSTVGSFAGKAAGDAGGTAYWNATVKHGRLGSHPTYVNGGSFAMTVRGPGNSVAAVVGTFSHHGGKIRTLDRGAHSGDQKYLVADTLQAVSTPRTSDGVGAFRVTLTHYRHRLLGRCVAYKARVSGTVTSRTKQRIWRLRSSGGEPKDRMQLDRLGATPGANPIMGPVERLVVTLKLRGGTQERAAELVAAGPPFDPANLSLFRHAVYLGDELAIFVFEGEDVEQRVRGIINDPVASASFAAWAPVLAGSPALAHEVYHWEAEG